MGSDRRRPRDRHPERRHHRDPGAGEIGVGYDKQARRARTAFAGAFVLQVKLYSTPVSDELMVGLGRSFARITKAEPAGVINGLGWGASGQALDGVLSLGGVGEAPLPCQGGGKIQSSPLAGSRRRRSGWTSASSAAAPSAP